MLMHSLTDLSPSLNLTSTQFSLRSGISKRMTHAFDASSAFDLLGLLAFVGMVTEGKLIDRSSNEFVNLIKMS